jgi:hypothetical protein
MLIYELVQSVPTDGLSDRDISVTPTINTVETVPENVEPENAAEDIPETPEGTMESFRQPVRRLSIPHEGNPGSLLDLVESKLEDTHISPTSSVLSNSTDDEFPEGQKSTRSTSFSSVHSRPTTPIFELKDPHMSPPPFKRVRREVEGEISQVG